MIQTLRRLIGYKSIPQWVTVFLSVAFAGVLVTTSFASAVVSPGTGFVANSDSRSGVSHYESFRSIIPNEARGPRSADDPDPDIDNGVAHSRSYAACSLSLVTATNRPVRAVVHSAYLRPALRAPPLV
ncbi:hypothetical protein SAMN05216203_2918 [Marinobacter daqiaonensis]|uniref:Uncharacterized protein n=1 Tax=Marinobacter daqiaonensis TaxID=650891 RepID=A0A1I6JDT4_9GAMM|nr:hypothetical protein [Marinobacter daqiaonensis]SFR77024.1 hypothetical protein SAMN05216203_2918 [Marinobacter daqiaonensis]